jgi:hypothetical protein
LTPFVCGWLLPFLELTDVTLHFYYTLDTLSVLLLKGIDMFMLPEDNDDILRGIDGLRVIHFTHGGSETIACNLRIKR